MFVQSWIRRLVVGFVLGGAALASAGCDDQVLKETEGSARLIGVAFPDRVPAVDAADFLVW